MKELSVGGSKNYFGGEKFGFFDIAFISYSCWFLAMETLGECKLPWESEFPRLQKWMKTCMERESMYKILPDPHKVLEFATLIR